VPSSPSNTLLDFRYVFYASSLTSTIHTKDFVDIIPAIKDHQNSCFWIDIHNPTDIEMKQLQRIFHIHPLTAEDITTEEPREKCEAFNHYYFICFRTFESDALSPNYLQPIGIYILIFKGFVLTVRCIDIFYFFNLLILLSRSFILEHLHHIQLM
jgi:magnesium transporter